MNRLFTDGDIKIMFDLKKKGTPNKEIARILKRSEASIAVKLSYLKNGKWKNTHVSSNGVALKAQPSEVDPFVQLDRSMEALKESITTVIEIAVKNRIKGEREAIRQEILSHVKQEAQRNNWAGLLKEKMMAGSKWVT